VTLALRRTAPLLLALAAVLLVAVAGLTQRSLYGTPLEPYAYSFFLDGYPLFAFAIVYGAARIGLAAFEPGFRRWPRLLGAPLGLALFLVACLHPTFGGLVIRPGYMAGSVAFLRNVPLPAAFALGAFASASVFGAALGIGTALARWRASLGWRPLGRALLSLGALGWAALVLASPRALGIDATEGWPAVPLSAAAALEAGAFVALALGPHALLARPAAERNP
jgi:hypothetical protein